MGPLLGRGVFVPLSWTLLPSDDGPIVRASSGPAPFRPADKAVFHKTKAGGQGGKEGEREKGERKALMEVWKGKGDRKEKCSGKQRGLTAGKKGL